MLSMYDLRELGDDREIEDFMNAAGLWGIQRKLVKKRMRELIYDVDDLTRYFSAAATMHLNTTPKMWLGA